MAKFLRKNHEIAPFILCLLEIEKDLPSESRKECDQHDGPYLDDGGDDA
jgi:hypothetical protein